MKALTGEAAPFFDAAKMEAAFAKLPGMTAIESEDVSLPFWLKDGSCLWLRARLRTRAKVQALAASAMAAHMGGAS